MGRVINKLNYTKRWINDIYSALQERGLGVGNYPLEKIGNIIRELGVGSGGSNIDTGPCFTNNIKQLHYNNFVYNYCCPRNKQCFVSNYSITFGAITDEREEY